MRSFRSSITIALSSLLLLTGLSVAASAQLADRVEITKTPSEPKVRGGLDILSKSRSILQQPEFAPVPEVASNYTFSTTQAGSLINMAAGTTTLLGGDSDDVASALVNIGFDFYFQGVRYSQFSVNENGVLRLGAVAQAGSPYKPLGQGATPLITAYGADQRTHLGDGKVHFRVLGAAPNRTLVVEWLNIQSNFNTGGTANLTYQVILSETTGQIDFIYGSMTMSALGAASADSQNPNIGFSSSSTAGTIGTVTAPQSGTPAPTFDGATATPVANLYTAGAITTLTSAADGTRRTFTFIPPQTPVAPTAGAVTAITPVSLTLNFVDGSANELGFPVYRSLDNVTFTYVGQAAADATSFTDTGLSPGTNYFYRVYSVTEGGLSSTFAAFTTASAPALIDTCNVAGGNWSAPGTWQDGSVPTAGDNVVITGCTVTIDVPSAVGLNLTVQNTGVLQYITTPASTLTLGGNATIDSGGVFQSAASGTVLTHILSVAGNVTNNGTLDFSTAGGSAGARITFATGAADVTFGGTGATTDINTITVAKGAQSRVVEINPTNFSIRGAATDTAGFLTLISGTFKISGTFTQSSRIYTAVTYTIPTLGGIWLNNPNFTVTGTASGTSTSVAGLLRVSAGTYNIGVTGADGMGGSAGGSFIVEGGTINTPRIDPQNAVTWNQSGGTVNIGVPAANTRSNFGAFEFFAPASSFTMSGGTVNLVQATVAATPIDIQILSIPTNISGGVVNVGTAATATNFNFRLRGNLPNIVVDNTVNPKTATSTASITSFGTTTINTGSTLVSGGFNWLVAGPSVVNNGTITMVTAGGRFYFLGAGPQTYSGSGTTTIISAGAVDLTIDNPAGLTIDPAAGPFITQRVNFFRGGITNANKITLGNGLATPGVVQYGLTASVNTAGNFDVAPTFNIGTAGQTLIYAQEGSARTTGPEIVTGRSITALTLSNTNGLTLAGGPLTVTGAMTLTAGVLTTGANIVTHNGAAARTTGYVDGYLSRSYTATGAYTYFVGQGGYTPVAATVTALTTNPSSLTVRSLDATLAGFSPAQSLSRNWQLDETGDLTVDLTFNYLDPGDVNGVETDYRVYRREGSGLFTNLCPGAPCVNTALNTGTVTGITQFSRWTMAELITPTAAVAGVGGRVLTADGRPIRNVMMVISGGGLAAPRYIVTGSMGYYSFEGLPVGEDYVVSVSSKRFSFADPVRVISLQENLSGEDFIANPIE